jgi:hypothetical protein
MRSNLTESYHLTMSVGVYELATSLNFGIISSMYYLNKPSCLRTDFSEEAFDVDLRYLEWSASLLNEMSGVSSGG